MSKPVGYKIALALTTIFQTSLSAIVPAGLCIVVAKLLVDKFSFPKHTTLVGVVFGVVAGSYSMIKYICASAKAVNKDDD